MRIDIPILYGILLFNYLIIRLIKFYFDKKALIYKGFFLLYASKSNACITSRGKI